ncbi:hypothetical protein PRIC2_008635 [Phytophthora ramorum]
MESTLSLVETAAHVGQIVRFIAAVQQIAADKRVLVKRQCVQACHVLHVGDASRQFFKVTCWGDAPPSLIQSTAASGSEGEANPMQLSSADAVLRVGDIVLFSSCRIKSYRGNVEAQFVQRNELATSSMVQLLYRKDRYFSTQDVQLKDLYPMIKWYKQHYREFIVEDPASSHDATNRAVIKDLRENMIASVICKLRSSKDGTSATSGGAVGVASELDGVLLCELIMYDTARDAMTVNLWDQHAEKRFVARLLEHRGAVEIDGIVVSLQALSNRLLANTTPHTTFRLLDADDPESIQLETKTVARGKPLLHSVTSTEHGGSATFATLEELEGSMFEGQATLGNVRIEQICLGRHFGNDSQLLTKFAPLLAERYCTACGQTLLELPSQKSNGQHRYAACANKCKVRRGSTVDAPCGWRYRRFLIILRDFRDERLQIEVDNQATVEMVGNIEAEVLMASCENERRQRSSSNSQFHAASAVASLLNAFVEDASQKFEAQLICTTVENRGSPSQPVDSYPDEEQAARRAFRLVSLVPSDAFSV